MGEKVVTETRFGNTLIIVTGECSPTATETIQEKLERIILRHLSDLKNYQEDGKKKNIVTETSMEHIGEK